MSFEFAAFYSYYLVMVCYMDLSVSYRILVFEQ
jgi:hypothetical protein